MGKIKNLWISQQEEEELLLEEEREKRWEQLEFTCPNCGEDISECVCDEFDFEAEQGARP